MRTLQYMGRLLATGLLSLGLCASAQSVTTTTLTVTSAGSAVTTVAAKTVITLTAAVATSSTPVTTGQVNFCDAAAAHCTDIHLLGTAQLTSAGTATLKFIPGIGNHSYKAVFVGTTANATSSTAASLLAVTGTNPTTTTIASSGSVGNYTLTATVTGNGSGAPTGTVSFLDMTNANSVLGTAPLVPVTGLKLAALSTPAASNTSGNVPYGVTVADFNEDGIPDLAVANASSNTVSILLGNGDGTFTLKSSLPTGINPAGILTADFNGDGKADLAIANYDSNTLTILLGNGDGTFTAAASPATGSLPYFIATADFNRDGNADLAVVNSGGTTLTILLGHGDGTFTAAASPTTGTEPVAVIAADFNNDGKIDLAAINEQTDNVTILLGNGDGTFTPAAVSPSTGSGNSPIAITVGDFNGDGNADLAVAATINDLFIFLGKGDGSFNAGPILSPGIVTTTVAAGDFNGDGKDDLAVGVTNISASNFATIYLGDGAGSFTSAATIPTGIQPLYAAAGDFNGDGVTDLVTSNSFSNTLSVLTTQSTATATINNVSVTGVHTHFVDASYPGDSNYSPSISGTTPLISPSGVTNSLTASPEPSHFGTAFTLTATVAQTAGGPVPTGTVIFSIDGTQVGTPVTMSGGAAMLAVAASTTYAVGTHTLTALYSGDTNYSANTLTGSHVVDKDPTTSVLLSDVPSVSTVQDATPKTVFYAEDFNVTGTTTPTGSSPLTGSYIFDDTYNGTTTLICTLPSAGTQCTTVNDSFDAGVHSLTYTYLGDVDNAASTSAPAVLNIQPDTTVTVLTSPSSTTVFGQPATFTATVTGNFAAPLGNLIFNDGTTPIGTVVVVPGTGLISTASFTTSSLSVGTHPITASFAGSLDFLASASPPPAATQQVIPPPTTDFIVTITPNPLVVGIGLPSSAIVTVTAINGWTADVTLACPASANLPYESTCTLVDTTIAGGSGTTALIMTTMSPHDCGSNVPYFTGTAQLEMKFGGAALAGLLIWLLPRKRRVLKGLLLALLCVLPGVMGCGRCTDLGTRPQTYAIPITATGVGTGVTHTVNLPMQVNL